jgi:hypothetical protein
MSHAVTPIEVNGLTTAVNVTVGSTSGSTALATLGGNTIMLSVGTIAASAFPIHIMFGKPNLAVTTSTGFRLPAGFVGRINAPMGATHIYYIRGAASDADLSMLGCSGGI